MTVVAHLLPSICHSELNTGSDPTANSAGNATGYFTVCYTNDTKSFREHFDATVSSTDFSDGAGHSIPASNFTVTQTNNVSQDQWTSQPSQAGLPRIGDIGFKADNGSIPAQSSGFSAWGPGKSLGGGGQTVQFGYAGRGTLNSHGIVNTALNIPSGTQAGTYTSDLTVSIVFTSANP